MSPARNPAKLPQTDQLPSRSLRFLTRPWPLHRSAALRTILVLGLLLPTPVRAQDEDTEYYRYERPGRNLAQLVELDGCPWYVVVCGELHRVSIEELHRILRRTVFDEPVSHRAAGPSRMFRKFKGVYITPLDLRGGESPWLSAWSFEGLLEDQFFILWENLMGVEADDSSSFIGTRVSTTKSAMELRVYVEWDPELRLLGVTFYDAAHDHRGPYLELYGKYNVRARKTLTTFSKYSDFDLGFSFTPKTTTHPPAFDLQGRFNSTTSSGKRRLAVDVDGPDCLARFGTFQARETLRGDDSIKMEFEFDSTWSSNYRMSWQRWIVDDYTLCVSTKRANVSIHLASKGELDSDNQSSCVATTAAHPCEVYFSCNSTWFPDSPDSIGMLNRTVFVTELNPSGSGRSYVQNQFYDDLIWLYSAASPAGGINMSRKTLGPMGWSRKTKMYVRTF